MKYVWCVGNQGPDRYHSKIGEVRDFINWKSQQAFEEVLKGKGVKVVRVVCYRESTSAQINSFKNWSLTAKTPEPLVWHEVDWIPR